MSSPAKPIDASTTDKLQYEALVPYKKFLCSANGHTYDFSKDAVVNRGKLWAILDQIFTNIVRLAHRIFSKDKEWIDNQTVLNKLKNNSRVLNVALTTIDELEKAPLARAIVVSQVKECSQMLALLKTTATSRDIQLLDEVQGIFDKIFEKAKPLTSVRKTSVEETVPPVANETSVADSADEKAAVREPEPKAAAPSVPLSDRNITVEETEIESEDEEEDELEPGTEVEGQAAKTINGAEAQVPEQVSIAPLVEGAVKGEKAYQGVASPAPVPSTTEPEATVVDKEELVTTAVAKEEPVAAVVVKPKKCCNRIKWRYLALLVLSLGSLGYGLKGTSYGTAISDRMPSMPNWAPDFSGISIDLSRFDNYKPNLSKYTDSWYNNSVSIKGFVFEGLSSLKDRVFKPSPTNSTSST